MEALDEQLRFAIAQKRLLGVSYTRSARIVEPHDYGIHKGVEKLLVYQLRGTSRSSQRGETGWRLLTVSKIDACVVLDETFRGSRGASHTNHLTWDTVYIRVS